MVRQMMWDRKNGDQRFKDTMHDFVTTYSGSVATTEDFEAMVEKHMSPEMDLQGNHKMTWFFKEYVYGTALPTYAFDYSFDKASSGDVALKFKLTQSGVDKNFGMLVPVYLELANGTMVRIGSPRMIGNATVDQTITLNGLKETPRRAVINYYDDVLAAN
jgi:aminopeptidase N